MTAVKTATRNKSNTPLDQYTLSFSQTPAAAGDTEMTFDQHLRCPRRGPGLNQVIATEELEQLLVPGLGGSSGVLSDLESCASLMTLTATPTR